MNMRETIRASLRLLDSRERRLLGLALLVQAATGLLDFAGVALVGMAGALSVAAVAGQSPPRQLGALFGAIGFESVSAGKMVAALAAVAATLLLTKSVLAPLLMARVLTFLARREAAVAARLANELFSRPLTFIQSRSTQETSLALIRGGLAATVTVLGQMVVAISELALIAFLSISLLIVNPAVAAGAIVFFGSTAWVLQKKLGPRAALFGFERASADTDSLRVVQEALGAYREIVVSDRRALYVAQIEALRGKAARAGAHSQLIATLPKYVFEVALVLGAFSLAAVLFSTQPLPIAGGTFAVFLAASSRILPAMLRLQTATLAIRAAAGPAATTFALAEELGFPKIAPRAEDAKNSAVRTLERDHADFIPAIELSGVTFSYPRSSSPAIRNITLSIQAGQRVAFVGRSGAGKSTVADIVLGVIQPDAGQVTIGGVPPAAAVRLWPGAVAYVPQEVKLVDDSVRANVALGLPTDLVHDELVWEALRRAQLEELFLRRPEGLETQIGEGGTRLSGGQRQRIGIARALFTQPRLLVLDEATSALDSETELAITTVLNDLDSNVTTIVIAHRLSTVRSADVVVYLLDGCATACGTFDQVCSSVPSLRRQAELMGIRPA